MLGCGGHAPSPSTPPPPPPPKIVLAVMPAESDVFPKAAQAASDALAGVHVGGVDETKVWKASLEVVQMQIECLDPSASCYAAAGKELHADRLLFAQITTEKKKQIAVTVTLFDVDTSAEQKQAHEVYANETAAVAGIPKLVEQVTQ
jgi:hypothetical protein